MDETRRRLDWGDASALDHAAHRGPDEDSGYEHCIQNMRQDGHSGMTEGPAEK